MRKGSGRTNNHQPSSRPRNAHVHSGRLTAEPDIALCVGPHQRNKDIVLLSSLVAVTGLDGKPTLLDLMFHVLLEEFELFGIGGNDSYIFELLGWDMVQILLNDVGLVVVNVCLLWALVGVLHFFPLGVGAVHEEDGVVAKRREVAQSIENSNAIGDLVLIEELVSQT